jgi:hypothetical protein
MGTYSSFIEADSDFLWSPSWVKSTMGEASVGGKKGDNVAAVGILLKGI